MRAFGHDLYLGTSLFDYILKSKKNVMVVKKSMQTGGKHIWFGGKYFIGIDNIFYSLKMMGYILFSGKILITFETNKCINHSQQKIIYK